MAKAAAGILTQSSCESLESSVAHSSSLVLGSTGWNPDVANAYNKIPVNYKSYMFSSKKSAGGQGDGVISHNASLHRSVKFFERKNHISTGHNLGVACLSPSITLRLSAKMSASSCLLL